MKNKEFGFKEVLVKVKLEVDAEFTKDSSQTNRKIIEAEVLSVGNMTSKFFKPGDKVLVFEDLLIQRNHPYFEKDERVLEMENQIICRIP